MAGALGSVGALMVGIGADNAPLTKGFADAQSQIRGFGDKMKNILGASVPTFTIAGAFKKAMDAFMGYEDAYVKMGATLASKGLPYKKLTDELDQFSQTLQKTTTYADDHILSTMQMGISMGLNVTKVKEVTKAAMGLASTFGMDLNSAMMKITRAANTGMGLQRYGISLNGVKDPAERLRIIMEKLGPMFQNVGAMANTTSGQWKRLTNAIDDFWEALGITVNYGLNVAGVLAKIREGVVWLTKWWEKLNPTIKAWILVAGLVVAAGGALTIAFNVVGLVVSTTIGLLSGLGGAIMGVVGFVGTLMASVASVTLAVLPAIALIAALAAVAYKMWQYLAGGGDAGDMIKDAANGIGTTFTSVVKQIRENWVEWIAIALDTTQLFWENIKALGKNMATVAAGFASTWISAVRLWWDVWSGVFKMAANVVMNFITTIVALFRDNFGAITESLANFILNPLEGFKMPKLDFSGFKTGFNSMKQDGMDFIDTIANGAGRIGTVFSKVLDDMNSTAAEKQASIEKIMAGGGWGDAFKKNLPAVMDFVKANWDRLKGYGGDLKKWFDDIVKGAGMKGIKMPNFALGKVGTEAGAGPTLQQPKFTAAAEKGSVEAYKIEKAGIAFTVFNKVAENTAKTNEELKKHSQVFGRIEGHITQRAKGSANDKIYDIPIVNGAGIAAFGTSGMAG